MSEKKVRNANQFIIPEMYVNSVQKYPSTHHSVCSQVEFHQIMLSHMPPIIVQETYSQSCNYC